MKFSKFQEPAGLLSENFQEPRPNFSGKSIQTYDQKKKLNFFNDVFENKNMYPYV
jgi:hypothetical protein